MRIPVSFPLHKAWPHEFCSETVLPNSWLTDSVFLDCFLDKPFKTKNAILHLQRALVFAKLFLKRSSVRPLRSQGRLGCHHFPCFRGEETAVLRSQATYRTLPSAFWMATCCFSAFCCLYLSFLKKIIQKEKKKTIFLYTLVVYKLSLTYQLFHTSQDGGFLISLFISVRI